MLKSQSSPCPGRHVRVPADGLLRCQRDVAALVRLLPDHGHLLGLWGTQVLRLHPADDWLQGNKTSATIEAWNYWSYEKNRSKDKSRNICLAPQRECWSVFQNFGNTGI